jgi:hypothetical protein
MHWLTKNQADATGTGGESSKKKSPTSESKDINREADYRIAWPYGRFQRTLVVLSQHA